MQNYDLIVIGSGPAGEKGAAQAAYFGKRVALIECGDTVGGACVNTGTIPSKILRESALYFSGIRQRGLYGVDYSLKEGLTVKNFMHRTDVLVETEREKVGEESCGPRHRSRARCGLVRRRQHGVRRCRAAAKPRAAR